MAGGKQLGAAVVSAGGQPGAGVNPIRGQFSEALSAEGGLLGAGVGAVVMASHAQKFPSTAKQHLHKSF